MSKLKPRKVKPRKSRRQATFDTAESISIQERRLSYWRLRLTQHVDRQARLQEAVSVAQVALAAELQEIADAPAKITGIEREIKSLRSQYTAIKLTPQIEKMRKLKEKLAALTADMSVEELAELEGAAAE